MLELKKGGKKIASVQFVGGQLKIFKKKSVLVELDDHYLVSE